MFVSVEMSSTKLTIITGRSATECDLYNTQKLQEFSNAAFASSTSGDHTATPSRQFLRELRAILKHLSKWSKAQVERIESATLESRAFGLLFSVTQSSQDSDPALAKALSKLEAQVSDSDQINLISLRTQLIPSASVNDGERDPEITLKTVPPPVPAVDAQLKWPRYVIIGMAIIVIAILTAPMFSQPSTTPTSNQVAKPDVFDSVASKAMPSSDLQSDGIEFGDRVWSGGRILKTVEGTSVPMGMVPLAYDGGDGTRLLAMVRDDEVPAGSVIEQTILEVVLLTQVQNESRRWVNHGSYVTSHLDGTRGHSEYFMGKRHGETRGWYAGGQQKALDTYVNGRAHGPSKSWYANGQLRHDSIYENDVEVSGKAWSEDGTEL